MPLSFESQNVFPMKGKLVPIQFFCFYVNVEQSKLNLPIPSKSWWSQQLEDLFPSLHAT